MKPIFSILIGITLSLMISCQNSNKPDPSLAADTSKTQKAIDPAANEETLTTIASEILSALKSKDYKALTAYFHPNEGVLFSPYGFIDTKSAKTLTKETFIQLIEDQREVTWGSYDGSGDPINLTAQQYLDKFVYNADFLRAEKTAYNQIIGKGNSLNNLSEIYPKLPFIEYHFSGFDEKYAGMDWTSLRLVFKLHQSNYYLIAVVHDQWTT